MRRSALRHWLPRGRHLVIAFPYAWMLMFFLIPFAIILKISLAETQVAIPPYTALVEYAEEKLTFVLNLGNYLYLLQDEMYFDSYLQSLRVASISTLLCLLIGYPIAWSIVHSSPSVRNVLLMLVVLPSWTSFLIRVYAWIGILKNNGLLNNFLIYLGVIDEPLPLLHTDLAVYIGIVYTYGISEHLGKDPDFYLLYKSSQKVKLAFFVLLPLMVETIYGIIEYFRR